MAYFEQTNITNEKGQIVNPATEESIILLRRMVKLLESQSATDIANRQRITIDAITGGVTFALPAGTNTIGSVNLGGADQRQFIDISRTNYNTGIRSKLTFS